MKTNRRMFKVQKFRQDHCRPWKSRTWPMGNKMVKLVTSRALLTAIYHHIKRLAPMVSKNGQTLHFIMKVIHNHPIIQSYSFMGWSHNAKRNLSSHIIPWPHGLGINWGSPEDESRTRGDFFGELVVQEAHQNAGFPHRGIPQEHQLEAFPWHPRRCIAIRHGELTVEAATACSPRFSRSRS